MSHPETPPATPPDETSSWGATHGSSTLRDLTGMTLGDFQVERRLGRGGMGEVYLARQVSLNRQVALKVLRPDLLSKETYLKRFEAEATAVAKLNHPNIVHVYTLGCIDGIRYIAMEYVQGTNLREYLLRKGALDVPQTLSIMKQAGLAVGAAGELGLVHRDIKPENLLLTKKGQLKITDFGLCRDLDGEPLNLTQTGVTMGTPLYMSPEQAQGHPCDHRSDLYSLGVTFYQMLAGQPPFRADTALAVALKHVKDAPVSLAIHRPDIPPELVRLVMKLIAKDPSDRYQSASEMLRDLAKVRDSLQTAPLALPALEASIDSGETAKGATTTGSKALGPGTIVMSAEPSRPRFGAKTVAWVVALCLIAGAVAGWLARPEDLLAQGAREPDAAPGLWMVPGWDTIVHRRDNPEDQYHYAQLSARREDQEAAWIAVPGFHPGASEWSVRAYVQLARSLLRRHDGERLKVLAGEIARWNKKKSHEKELADIMLAGAKALNGDLDGVIDDFTRTVVPHALIDPALMELSLEVTQQAEREATRPGASPTARSKLREIQLKLYSELFQTENRARPLGARRAS